MKYMAMAVTAGLLLAGCGGKETTTETTPAEATPAAPAAQSTMAAMAPKKDVGDLEAGIDFELTLDEEVAPAGATSEKLENQMQKLNMVTVSVEGPAPAELWLNIDLETQLEFPDRPVAARGRVVRELDGGEKETVSTFETVFDENASMRKRRIEGNYPPQHFRVEVLQGLTDLPETMLVYGEIDAVFMPEGTDPATIQPATAKGDVDDETMLLSNPLRVNFTITEAPAPAEPTPAPGAPDSAATPEAPAAETSPDGAAEEAPAEEAPAEAAPAEEAPAEAAPAEEAPAATES